MLTLWIVLSCLSLAAPGADNAVAKTPVPVRAVYGYQTKEPWVALTFDDGPYPENTGPLLDVLKRHGAKATFFVLGRRAKAFPDLLLRERREGHEIANHSFNHAFFRRHSVDLDPEIGGAHRLIEKLTGTPPRFFRPAGGETTAASMKAAAALGETTTLWTLDTRDWAGRHRTVIVNQVLARVRPGDIILLHDGVPNTHTVAAVDELLRNFEHRGLKAVTLSELAAKGRPHHVWQSRPMGQSRS